MKHPWKDDLMPLMPERLAAALSALPDGPSAHLQEIRLRAQGPLMITAEGRDSYISPEGCRCPSPASALQPTAQEVAQLLEAMAQHSLYRMEEQLRQGYMTLPRGYRVGLCGQAVVEGGSIRYLQPVAGMAIRIARQITGCAKGVLGYLLRGDGGVHATLIVSPPGLGKTTLLRDLTRLISLGGPGHPGRRVGLVDERSELAACYRGVPQLDVGPRTDVLDGCPKDQGMALLLRALSPKMLVCDEIAGVGDAQAILAARAAGVGVIATCHGGSLEQVRLRPGMETLLREGVFERLVCLGARNTPGQVASVIDLADGRELYAQQRSWTA